MKPNYHMEYQSTCQDDTIQIGTKTATTLTGGDIVILHGDLGAGKTTLVKGLAETLGISQNDITSPTFTIMNVYTLPKAINNIQTLVHIDTYRMESEDDLIEIGIEEYLEDPNTLTIIEWPEKVQSLLQKKNLTTIAINHTSPTDRTITITKNTTL